MNIISGIRLLEQTEGSGPLAEKGGRVLFNLRMFLNRGDEVPLNQLQIQDVPKAMIRAQGEDTLIDRTVVLGKREVIAAVEYTLLGMRVGGYRKVKSSPHLAYGKKGIPGLIPENAVLVLEIWLRDVTAV